MISTDIALPERNLIWNPYRDLRSLGLCATWFFFHLKVIWIYFFTCNGPSQPKPPWATDGRAIWNSKMRNVASKTRRVRKRLLVSLRCRRRFSVWNVWKKNSSSGTNRSVFLCFLGEIPHGDFGQKMEQERWGSLLTRPRYLNSCKETRQTNTVALFRWDITFMGLHQKFQPNLGDYHQAAIDCTCRRYFERILAIHRISNFYRLI